MRTALSLDQIIELISKGELPLAEKECEYRLSNIPDHAAAWNLLGALRLQGHKLSEAKTALQQAILLDGQLAKAHHNLGSVLAAESNVPEAIASYRQALAIDPTLIASHYALGSLLKQQQRFEEAIPHLQTAAAVLRHIDAITELADALRNSGKLANARDELEKHFSDLADDPVYLNLLGNARLDLGLWDAASAAYRQATLVEPNNPLAHNNLGFTLLKLSRYDEAVAAFRQAVSLAPDNPDFLFSLGCALTDQGNTNESIPLLEQGTKRWANHINGLTNLGVAYITARQPERAISPLQQAITLAPDDPELHNNLGATYEALSQNEQAGACYLRAISLKPDYPQPYNNLGNIALSALELDKALTYYQKSLTLDPNLADAHMNQGLVHLLRGEFEAGWPEYEWRRFATSEKNKYQTFSKPEWTGESLNGKRILLCAEQGLGDTIQFVRYAKLVKDMGATVILQCQPPLTRLLQMASGIDILIDTDTPLPEFDTYVPLLSLPKLLGTKIDTIPHPEPYLAAQTSAKVYWANRLKDEKRLKIGFAWAGNPTHRNDRNRSCALEWFLALAKIPNTLFFSFQKGPRSIEPAQGAASDYSNIIDFTNELNDFADSAALLANLDLLITVDTSLAHLAGSIGVPTWVALPFCPDWRWLLDRSDSPWYTNLKLFRQAEANDWGNVFDRIKNELSLLPQHQLS